MSEIINSVAGGSRRDFIKGTAATAAVLTAASMLRSKAYAGGTDVIKIGLVGCGGRGTGAAQQALNADPNVKLVAMGDIFKDHLDNSLKAISGKKKLAEKVDVPPDRQFVGFDAIDKVLQCVDLVVLATPPHFRPEHVKKAVAANKHMFVEKPIAVDSPGVRSVMASCEEAKKKNLAVVSGLCWRYDLEKKATMQKVLDGGVGDIVAIQTTYNTGALWNFPRKPEWSDMEWQLRNWLYFTWLSGDHIVEQAIHSIDKMSWAMHEQPPAVAWGTGGRQSRTGKEYGHVFDHFAVTYEYANGVRGYHFSRQQQGTASEVNDFIMGTKGVCNVFGHSIKGETNWKYEGPSGDMYQLEHNALFKSIRDGSPINNGEYMCRTTMLAIMGRMVAYTGKKLTWDQALNSEESLTPPGGYNFGPIETAPVAIPGQTTFK